MQPTLKLNYRNTFIIGSAFFSILMLWQVYNTYAPTFLEDLLRTRLGEEANLFYIVGIIMALDNLFALFMLPLFGMISDKTKSKYGRRIPYIVFGLLASAIVFPFIAVAYILNSLAGVIVVMLIVLIIMNIYRNPAIALMPDITPKPIRGKANGVINLVGYFGAILAGVLVSVFGDQDPVKTLIPFLIVAGFMIISMLIMILKIDENALVAENEKDMSLGEALSETIEPIIEDKPLSKADRKNFIILLFAVFFWFVSFNAVETFMSIYARNVFGNINVAGTITIILVISSIITFMPAALLALKIGRKRSVMLGLLFLMGGLGTIILQDSFNVIFMISIAFCGSGWALVNVNSYPMIVEMSHKNNVGRYTGYYYTASMMAQTITPVLVGGIMALQEDNVRYLFPYATVMMFIAFVIFILFKESKATKVDAKIGLEAFDVD